MRERTRVWLLAGGITALVAALAVVGWLGWSQGEAATVTTSGPLAVVLMPDIGTTSLVVVDLRAARVVRRVELRSLATDIAVDETSGVVVGAQAGGLGADADRVASLTDPRSGSVRYVELPASDPGDVACVDGHAFLLHSTREASGAVFSVVDVGAAKVTGSGHVPGPPGIWSAAAGAVWTTGEDELGRASLCRLDAGDLTVSASRLTGLRTLGLADAGGRLFALGMRTSAGADRPGMVAELEGPDGSLIGTAAVAGLPRGPRHAVMVGHRLVVGDWSGDEPETRALRMLDSDTLRDLGPLPVDGVPCALAAWGDRLLVVDREKGRLLMIDPESARTLAVIDLGQAGPVFADVEVVSERGGAD